MHRYYPIYLDIVGEDCLIVGGGGVAARKAVELVEAGARVCVVSPVVKPALQGLADGGVIEIILAPYDASFLANKRLVFAATDRRDVNAQVALDARARHIAVNVVDAPEEGDFVTPAVVRRGELCLSISTGGASPLLAGRLREEMERRFGPEYGDFVELMGRMRAYIKRMTDDPARRRDALTRLVDAESALCAHLREGRFQEAQAAAEALVDEALKTSGDLDCI